MFAFYALMLVSISYASAVIFKDRAKKELHTEKLRLCKELIFLSRNSNSENHSELYQTVRSVMEESSYVINANVTLMDKVLIVQDQTKPNSGIYTTNKR